METHVFVIDTTHETRQYTIHYPIHVDLPIAWMRSVNRNLKRLDIPKATRQQFFLNSKPQNQDTYTSEWTIASFNRRLLVKKEKSVKSTKRVTYTLVRTPKAVVSRKEANRRVRRAAIRSAKRMKVAQEQLNQSVAPFILHGLLKNEAKWQRNVRLHNALRPKSTNYGVGLALQPTVEKVRNISDSLYTSRPY